MQVFCGFCLSLLRCSHSSYGILFRGRMSPLLLSELLLRLCQVVVQSPLCLLVFPLFLRQRAVCVRELGVCLVYSSLCILLLLCLASAVFGQLPFG